MAVLILSSNYFLDDFILNAEFCRLSGLSQNAYKFWKNAVWAKYEGQRTIFLKKSNIHEKHKQIIASCTKLNGFVSSSAFCSFTGLSSSHLTKSNASKLYDMLEIMTLEGVKFVNLKRFYDDLGLAYHYNLYIEKCHFFSPLPMEKKIQLTPTMCVGYY